MLISTQVLGYIILAGPLPFQCSDPNRECMWYAGTMYHCQGLSPITLARMIAPKIALGIRGQDNNSFVAFIPLIPNGSHDFTICYCSNRWIFRDDVLNQRKAPETNLMTHESSRDSWHLEICIFYNLTIA